MYDNPDEKAKRPKKNVETRREGQGVERTGEWLNSICDGITAIAPLERDQQTPFKTIEAHVFSLPTN